MKDLAVLFTGKPVGTHRNEREVEHDSKDGGVTFFPRAADLNICPTVCTTTNPVWNGQNQVPDIDVV